MKLLIITQKVDKNDAVLGFFHNWLIEFSKQTDILTIICLEKGDYTLPKNVKVLSLGKENGRSRIKYLINFYKYVWQQRKNYDYVFIHMNQMYVLLGFWLWWLLNKKIYLWYAHGKVSLSLRLAVLLVKKVFSSTPSGLRIKTKKLKIVGQGIDLNYFQLKIKPRLEYKKIVVVGRISPIKNIDLIVKNFQIINNKKIKLYLVGKPVLSTDRIYLNKIKAEIKNCNNIIFTGKIIYEKLNDFYQTMDLAVNLSDTGSLDKTILEGLAVGLPLITSNTSAKELLGEFHNNGVYLLNSKSDFKKILLDIIKTKPQIYPRLREYIKQKHSLKRLVEKIILEME